MSRWRGRWRPSLGFVLGGALVGTLGLSYAGLVALRYLGPEIGFRNAAYLLAAAILLVTALLGWLLVRLLLRPIRALEAYATAVRDGGAAPAPRHFGTRELHATARSVMEMAEALRDREATIRSYTDHVTHELKTPVSAIRAAVELMQDGGGLAAEDARLAGEIDGARGQIEAQLAALRAAASAREARYLGQTRLSDLTLDHPGLRIEVTGAEVALPIGAEGLALVLGHLMQNAAEHGAGALYLSATRTGGRAALEVADDGPGISAGNAGHVFEPFYTTRREGGGTGMGLTIARNLLAAHRGRIELVPSESGARFRISFAG